MADIIEATPEAVFELVSTPGGLDLWWTKRSSGEPGVGEIYKLYFGPEWDWRAEVTRCVPGTEFELRMTRADEDWTGTVVGFRFQEKGKGTKVSFYHTGWPEANHHFRRSSYCWAMYLRVLKRYVELGEKVTYEERTGA
jgi:uncharacterized protein YndB with AHSA1/START domain